VSLSIIEAIELGQWDYEPVECAPHEYDSTEAMPGTSSKVEILAERLSRGLPLWHPQDRLNWSKAQDSFWS
jgi:hypothetical protein